MEETTNYILTCDGCNYTFAENAIVDRCPDCGKFQVRVATEDEIKEYYQIRRELELEEQVL